MNKKIPLTYIQTFLASIFMLAVGFFIGSIFFNQQNNLADGGENRNPNTKTPFINALLECKDEEVKELKSFKDQLLTFTNSQIEKKEITEGSIYFRDLDNGLWIENYKDDKFSPASLLKIPIAMSLLKEAETNPSLLNQKILLQHEYENIAVQNYVPEKRLEIGKTYTVKVLLEQMLVYSDNVAQNALLAHIPVDFFRVFNDLGIVLPEGDTKENFMTIRDYARFFRVLYNGSYLSKENSNYILELLSETTFEKGITRDIDKEIVVSHKFGERLNNGMNQLHDCGIIYLPKRPYLLCVMSRGHDFEKLSNYIAEVSKIVYKEISIQTK